MCPSRRGIRPGILVLTSVMTVDRQDILEVERRPGPIRWWFTPCTLKLRLTRADRRSWLLGKLPFNINLRSPDLCSHLVPHRLKGNSYRYRIRILVPPQNNRICSLLQPPHSLSLG